MTMRTWMSPPRHLLGLFFAVTLAPAAGLVWLGWSLLEQDRQLETQRAMERKDLFGKFVRGSAARETGVKGIGIGLAIVDYIIRAQSSLREQMWAGRRMSKEPGRQFGRSRQRVASSEN
jgi:threonine/homoserine/homoserine lactone efflux protein